MTRLLSSRQLLCVAALAAVSCSPAAAAENDTLQLVQVLFRHGARTPVLTCPTDHNSDAFLTAGLGQLTNEGKRMQLELGQYLRKRYRGFLNEQYHRNYTHVRSTDVDRTLESALANLAGLYPPNGSDVWNQQLAWQPIPVHTVPELEDQQLNFIAACARFHQEMARVLTTDEWRRRDQENGPLYDFLTQHCGVPVRDIVTLSMVYDLLLIESRTNLTLPKWAGAKLAQYNNRSVYPDLLRPLTQLAFQLLSWDDQLRRLGGGPLLTQITESMRQKVAGSLQPPNRQLLMYSGHDADIAALLGTLGIYTGIPPPLASCVIVELHRDSAGGYYVQMFYRNETTHEPYSLRLPNCNEICPWEAFVDLTASVRPTDVAQECTIPHGTPTRHETEVIALATTLALLLVLLLLGLGLYLRSRRQQGIPSAYAQISEVPT